MGGKEKKGGAAHLWKLLNEELYGVATRRAVKTPLQRRLVVLVDALNALRKTVQQQLHNIVLVLSHSQVQR